jgi:hypothetical protein
VSKLDRLRQSIDGLEKKLPPQPERYEHYHNPHDRDSEYDIHGKVDLGLAFRTYPALVARMREVPARAVTEEGDDDEGAYSLIVCPCGQKPIVRSELRKCEGCERWYLRFERAAWVLYGDMDVPERKAGAIAVD